MSLVIVYEYEIDPASAEAFEAAYGSGGDWARYFAGAEGYRGTELLRAAGGHYLVIDRWDSETGYDAFLAAHADEYGSRNQDAARLWLQERIVGRFETA